MRSPSATRCSNLGRPRPTEHHSSPSDIPGGPSRTNTWAAMSGSMWLPLMNASTLRPLRGWARLTVAPMSGLPTRARGLEGPHRRVATESLQESSMIQGATVPRPRLATAELNAPSSVDHSARRTGPKREGSMDRRRISARGRRCRTGHSLVSACRCRTSRAEDSHRGDHADRGRGAAGPVVFRVASIHRLKDRESYGWRPGGVSASLR